MTAVDMLRLDIKHCRLDEAEKLCDYFAEESWNYVNENEDMNDEFRFTQEDCIDEISIAEFLWHHYWDDFIDYMRAKYLDLK